MVCNFFNSAGVVYNCDTNAFGNSCHSGWRRIRCKCLTTETFMIDLTVAVKLDSGVKRLRGEPEESFTHTVKPRLTAISLSRPLYSGPKTKLSETFSYLKNLCNTATSVIRVKTAGFLWVVRDRFYGVPFYFRKPLPRKQSDNWWRSSRSEVAEKKKKKHGYKISWIYSQMFRGWPWLQCLDFDCFGDQKVISH